MRFNKANLIDGKLSVDELDMTSIADAAAVVTIVPTDYVLITDTSDSNEFKKGLASDLGGGSGMTQQQAEGLI